MSHSVTVEKCHQLPPHLVQKALPIAIRLDADAVNSSAAPSDAAAAVLQVNSSGYLKTTGIATDVEDTPAGSDPDGIYILGQRCAARAGGEAPTSLADTAGDFAGLQIGDTGCLMTEANPRQVFSNTAVPSGSWAAGQANALAEMSVLGHTSVDFSLSLTKGSGSAADKLTIEGSQSGSVGTWFPIAMFQAHEATNNVGSDTFAITGSITCLPCQYVRWVNEGTVAIPAASDLMVCRHA